RRLFRRGERHLRPAGGRDRRRGRGEDEEERPPHDRRRGLYPRALGPPRLRRRGRPRLLRRGPGLLRHRGPLGRRPARPGGMKVRILAVGTDRSGLFEPAIAEYSRRIERHARLELVEVPPSKKGGSDAGRAREEEGRALLGRLRGGELVVVLDERGEEL